jgi:hypothetical protein
VQLFCCELCPLVPADEVSISRKQSLKNSCFCEWMVKDCCFSPCEGMFCGCCKKASKAPPKKMKFAKICCKCYCDICCCFNRFYIKL